MRGSHLSCPVAGLVLGQPGAQLPAKNPAAPPVPPPTAAWRRGEYTRWLAAHFDPSLECDQLQQPEAILLSSKSPSGNEETV